MDLPASLRTLVQLVKTIRLQRLDSLIKQFFEALGVTASYPSLVTARKVPRILRIASVVGRWKRGPSSSGQDSAGPGVLAHQIADHVSFSFVNRIPTRRMEADWLSNHLVQFRCTSD